MGAQVPCDWSLQTVAQRAHTCFSASAGQVARLCCRVNLAEKVCCFLSGILLCSLSVLVGCMGVDGVWASWLCGVSERSVGIPLYGGELPEQVS